MTVTTLLKPVLQVHLAMQFVSELTIKLAVKNDNVATSNSIGTDVRASLLLAQNTHDHAVAQREARANIMIDEKRMHMAAAEALGLHRHWLN
ncbi:MAG: hypothetical protein VX223_12100 [Myxococcota bacterium]|nr:hypothetical protein [Myxococcota bacterium]